MSKFKVGDVVYLKSGGPPMTVQSIEVGQPGEGTEIRCVWFDKNVADARQGVFVDASLTSTQGVGVGTPDDIAH